LKWDVSADRNEEQLFALEVEEMLPNLSADCLVKENTRYFGLKSISLPKGILRYSQTTGTRTIF
jgi:hypothetical protein